MECLTPLEFFYGQFFRPPAEPDDITVRVIKRSFQRCEFGRPVNASPNSPGDMLATLATIPAILATYFGAGLHGKTLSLDKRHAPIRQYIGTTGLRVIGPR